MFNDRAFFGISLPLLVLVGSGLVLPVPAAAQPASTCFARLDSDGVVYSRLQEALDAAEIGDTVRLAGLCDQVETLNGTPQVGYIDQDLTVRGGYTETNWMISDPVANPTVIDADNAGRGLRVSGAITVGVENLTIVNGDGSGLGGAQFNTDGGGAILNTDANLTLNRVTLFDNRILAGTSQEARGGAVSSDGGDVSINHSTIYNNQVSGSFSYGGGVMVANGTLTLNQSEVRDNTAVADNFDGSPQAEGGGVYVASNGSLLVSSSRIAGNDAQGPGGGVATGANATLTMTDAEVVSNVARGQGGGLYLPGTTAEIGQSRIQGNIVNGSFSGSYGRQGGGGLYTDGSSDVTIRQSLVASNSVNSRGLGGAIAVRCFRCTNTVLVENSTLSGNTAVEGGGGFSSFIEQDFIGATNSVIAFDHVSVINNNATSGNALHQERQTGDSSHVGNVTSSFSYRNSLIAGNGGADECHNSATHGSIDQVSNGYNLFIAGAGCTNNGTTDQTVIDEATLFGDVVANALAADNTHPLVNDAGNPAFDAVPEGTNGCEGGISVDQRGGVRAGGPGFGDTGCDIGAYELNTTLFGLELQPPAATQSGVPGETVTYTLTVTNTGNSTDSFDFTASGNSWDVGVPEITTLNAGDSGDVDVTVTIPNDALDGDEDAVTITAASTGDPTESAFATLTTTAVDEAIGGLTATNDSPTTLGQITTFNASVTAGSNLVYDWAFGDGNTALDAGATPTHTYGEAGEFTATVTARNAAGQQTATTEATITNDPPLADAGPDQSVVAGELVTLDGSGSSDPDGHEPLTFQWIQIAGGAVTLSDPAAANPEFTAPSDETPLIFELTVTDSFGLAGNPDTVEVVPVVTVGPVAPAVPVPSLDRYGLLLMALLMLLIAGFARRVGRSASG